MYEKMKIFKIALVPGDGVGSEIVGATRELLEALQGKNVGLDLDFTEYLAGKAAYEMTGDSLPAGTIEGMATADATLMGAMATGLVPPPSPMGKLRKEMDLYADVRPIKSYPGVWCHRDNLDIIIIREATQGFFADRNLYKGNGEFMPDRDTVLSLRVLTRYACERIARFACDYAARLCRKKITVAHKANVLALGDNFFLDICRREARNYPALSMNDEYIDTVANKLISRPEDYDVILTTNMYGDVVSDEAAALVSSLVPTANFGKDCAIFRPVHEAMLDIAGKNIVNPVPTMLCAVMMLEYLGAQEAAASLRKAVEKVLARGQVRTADLGGRSSTTEITRAIIKAVEED
jgi:isocitrate/isopropylmalate dehydrogenase